MIAISTGPARTGPDPARALQVRTLNVYKNRDLKLPQDLFFPDYDGFLLFFIAKIRKIFIKFKKQAFFIIIRKTGF
jgi:hypothetical protein